MRLNSPAMDPAAKRWLGFLAATVLGCIAAGVYLNIHDRPTAADPPGARLIPATASVELNQLPVNPYPPADQLPAGSFPVSTFSQYRTPEERAALRKELVNKQADYLLELRLKFPKTATLPTPEQIEDMRKKGETVQ